MVIAAREEFTPIRFFFSLFDSPKMLHCVCVTRGDLGLSVPLVFFSWNWFCLLQEWAGSPTSDIHRHLLTTFVRAGTDDAPAFHFFLTLKPRGCAYWLRSDFKCSITYDDLSLCLPFASKLCFPFTDILPRLPFPFLAEPCHLWRCVGQCRCEPLAHRTSSLCLEEFPSRDTSTRREPANLVSWNVSQKWRFLFSPSKINPISRYKCGDVVGEEPRVKTSQIYSPIY